MSAIQLFSPPPALIKVNYFRKQLPLFQLGCAVITPSGIYHLLCFSRGMEVTTTKPGDASSSLHNRRNVRLWKFPRLSRPRQSQTRPRPVFLPVTDTASLCQGRAGPRSSCQGHLGTWLRGPGCPFPPGGKGRKPSSHLPGAPEGDTHTRAPALRGGVYAIISRLPLVVSKQICS